MGFATIGLSLFYLAWRYNILFVTDNKLDTRGLIYPRALKQLFAGIYIAELCMIGIFGASTAFGPLVLMIIFLVFTALFHISLNNAINPLLYNLPRSLIESEDESLRIESQASSNLKNGHTNSEGEKSAAKPLDGPASSAPAKKPGFISKFLKPWNFDNYETMRNIVPEARFDIDSPYTEEVEQNAYYPPAVNSRVPLLWIPEDPAGISKQEIRDTGKVIPITDEGCVLNDKNKLEWDTEGVRPPLWEEKVYY